MTPIQKLDNLIEVLIKVHDALLVDRNVNEYTMVIDHIVELVDELANDVL